MAKQYGLIIPGRETQPAPKKPQALRRPSFFDESSSDSDDDAAPQKQTPTVASGPTRVARLLREKALAEDPTIFQYDEIYDDMDNKRDEAKKSNQQEPRAPKYIGLLMKHADQRKLAYELRTERQVQKDREAEGEKFKDKDTYVTATYRKKLESMREMQEKEKREEYLEAIGDVTKQKDLDGFYRHLYEQKLGTQQPPVVMPNTAPATENVSYKPIKPEKAAVVKQRSYRRRQSSDEEREVHKSNLEKPSHADDVQPSTSKAHLTNNIDADSDFSIDDSSDEDDQDKQKERENETQNKQPTKIKTTTESADILCAGTDKTTTEPVAKDNGKVEKPLPDSTTDLETATETPTAEPEVVRQPIDRSHIWKKRTVGDSFNAALARYLERKKARNA